VDLYSALGDK